MLEKLLLGFVLSIIFISPVHAVRNLPAGSNPKPIEGEAVGSIPQLKGSGTLTFITTGGDARLVAACGDLSEERARVNSLTCEGIDVIGTFTGGPNGIAIFNIGSGEIKLQLTDGKVFSYASQGFSMNFTVTDPSIFDDWIEDAPARDSGARVSEINGQVEIACPPDIESWDVMKMGRIIYVDCHIKTGEDSEAIISFSDMTTFKLKSETEIVIDTPPEKDSKISLITGNIWANVKQMVKDGTMKVHMSQAVAGIKGTTFVLTESKTESTIKVIEGSVSFTSNNTKETALLSAGESITGIKTGLLAKTNFDVSSETKNWQVVIDSNKRYTDADKVNLRDRISNWQNLVEQNDKMPYIIGGAITLFILFGVAYFLLTKMKSR